MSERRSTDMDRTTPGAPLRRYVPRVKRWLYRTGALSMIRRLRPSRGLAILRYHAVSDPATCEYADPSICVSPAGFDAHLDLLSARYTVVPLPDAVEALRAGESLAPNAVAITFDDGYADNLVAARLLARRGMTATFYVTAGCIESESPLWMVEIRALVARLTSPVLELVVDGRPIRLDAAPGRRRATIRSLSRLIKSETVPVRESLREQLRAQAGPAPTASVMLSWHDLGEMLDLGMTIGAHTLTHANLPSAGPDVAHVEIAGSKSRLNAALGVDVTQFSYPNGGAERYYDPFIRQLVVDAGFRGATTSNNGFVDATSDVFLLERLPVADRVEDLAYTLEVERLIAGPEPGPQAALS